MKKIVTIILTLVAIGCWAAPKPIARKIRMHRSEECAELSELEEVIAEELAMLSLGKRSESGSITPVTPFSSLSAPQTPLQPDTPTLKRARSSQPDDSLQKS